EGSILATTRHHSTPLAREAIGDRATMREQFAGGLTHRTLFQDANIHEYASFGRLPTDHGRSAPSTPAGLGNRLRVTQGSNQRPRLVETAPNRGRGARRVLRETEM